MTTANVYSVDIITCFIVYTVNLMFEIVILCDWQIKLNTLTPCNLLHIFLNYLIVVLHSSYNLETNRFLTLLNDNN